MSKLSEIRQKLNHAFDDSDFSAFCHDFYPRIYDNFGQGMRKDSKINYFLGQIRLRNDFKRFRDYVCQISKMSDGQSKQLNPLIYAISKYISSSVEAKTNSIAEENIRTDEGLLVKGTLLNNERYHITHYIAQGGFGAVYKAHDLEQEKTVAIKELIYHSRDNNDDRIEAFRRESEQLRKLSYHTIPKMRDCFEEDDWPYLVMDFIEGQTLKEELIVRRKPFEVAQVLRWADSLLNTLDYLHKQTQPLIHRDIKPDNLKRKNENEVFLLDFGIAKGGSPQHKDTILHGFTRGYSPPEQTAHMTTDVRSELYALGATLYCLLTNERPPETAQRLPHLMLLNSDPLKPANELNPSVPSKLAEVLTKAMAIKPDERFQNVAEMRHALDASSDDSSGNNEQIDQGKDTNTFRRRIVRVAVGAVAVIAVVMILVMLITNIILPSTGQIEVYMDQQPLDLEQLPQLTAGEAVTLEVKVIDEQNQTHEGGDLECTWTVDPPDQNNQIVTDECQTLYIPSMEEQTETVTIEVRSRQQQFEKSKSIITFNIQN